MTFVLLGLAVPSGGGDLRQKRKQAIGALKELKSRLASTTALLAQHQSEAIQQVTQGRDFALLTCGAIPATRWASSQAYLR